MSCTKFHDSCNSCKWPFSNHPPVGRPRYSGWSRGSTADRCGHQLETILLIILELTPVSSYPESSARFNFPREVIRGAQNLCEFLHTEQSVPIQLTIPATHQGFSISECSALCTRYNDHRDHPHRYDCTQVDVGIKRLHTVDSSEI